MTLNSTRFTRSSVVLTAGLLTSLVGCADLGLGSTETPLNAYCTVNVIGKGVKDIESDYLPNVIECENPGVPLEAAKAQAIAARSYVYYRLSTGNGTIQDSQGDQVYSCGRTPSATSIAAVNATRGVVLRYRNTQVAAFFVAGATNPPASCVGGSADPTATERNVTYNEGRSGNNVTQTRLGWVNAGNFANRGCMSQNGSACLARAGRSYTDILRFYYGSDIGIETATGSCGGAPGMDAGVAMPPTPITGGKPLLRKPFASAERVTSPVLCDRNGRPHKGVDFGMPNGTPVLAAAAGVVVYKQDGTPNVLGNGGSSGYGNFVILAHAGGRATLYAHMMPGNMPAIGTTVNCGDQVGLSGQTTFGTGPHLHFEVRDGLPAGVSNSGAYQAYLGLGFLDPYGETSCRGAPLANLWGSSCAAVTQPANPVSNAQFARATYPQKVRCATPGQRLNVQWTLRNSGNTTWVPTEFALLHRAGGRNFGISERIELPAGRMIAPGAEATFGGTAVVPTEPGTYRGEWQMNRNFMGAQRPFGAAVFLELEVCGAGAPSQPADGGTPSQPADGGMVTRTDAGPAPSGMRGCMSYTLGRRVNHNTCVQVAYAGCGASSCGWYKCTDGQWLCSAEDACDAGQTNPSSQCPGGCDSYSDCGTCAAVNGCSWCGESNSCVRSADRAACTAPQSDEAQCSACIRENAACAIDSQCCQAGQTGGSASMRCFLGLCVNTATCGMMGTTCVADGTAQACCRGLTCQPQTFGGARNCCLRDQDPCATSEECCGEMTCSSGRCTCRPRGQSCASTQDCCAGGICNNGTCQ